MTILLNPKYEHLRPFLLHIDEHFKREGEVLHRGRNVVKTLRVNGLTLCVKHYGRPKLRTRLALKVYGTQKGKKAYLRPLQLRERGFESPESVAYVAYRRGLTYLSTYFVCLHSDYRYSMAAVSSLQDGERQELLAAFAGYVARLHENGFLHRDFSSDNILYDKVKGRYHFSLIDTNSLRCGRSVGLKAGCRNLARLQGDGSFFVELLDAYARERGVDPERCRRFFGHAVRTC